MIEQYSDFNYNELLQLEEWKAKRDEILERDNFSCQRCGKQKNDKLSKLRGANINCADINDQGLKIIGKTYSGSNIIEMTFKEGKILYAKTNIPIQAIKDRSELLLTIQLANQNLFNKEKKLSTIEHSEITYFYRHGLNLNSKIKLKERLYRYDAELDLEGFWLIEPENEIEFIKGSFLHVHHLCYRKSYLPWEYENDELLTLCNICHLIAHENYHIPFYISGNVDYHILKACIKCAGTGNIPKYKHVQNGICYKCSGSGFSNWPSK